MSIALIAFKVLLKELQSLGLDVNVLDEHGKEVKIMETIDYGDTDLNSVIEGDRNYAFDNNESYEEHGFSTKEWSEEALDGNDDSDFEEDYQESDAEDDFADDDF